MSNFAASPGPGPDTGERVQVQPTLWIDTHCHLDFIDFSALEHDYCLRAATKNIAHCVLPAVGVSNFEAVRRLAHTQGYSYALGIHPLYVKNSHDGDLAALEAQLTQHAADPHLVAVGEVGLDYWVPELTSGPLLERQTHFFMAQLRLARQHGLPVILHSLRAVDAVLKGLRAVAREHGHTPWHGIAHAFSGSSQQAQAFIDLGFKLGFGGALTYARAQNLRRLAATLPLSALVMETDAPDMPPHWLYQTAAQRAAGTPQGRNTPAELPRIGAELAALRGITPEALAAATTHNACEALPKLKALLAKAV